MAASRRIGDSTDQLLAAAVIKRDRAERRQLLVTGLADGELPIATAITSVVFIVFGIADGIAHPSEAVWRVAISVVPGLVMGGVSLMAFRRRIPPRFVTRIYGGLVLVAVLSTLGTVLMSSRAEELAYSLLILAAAGAAVPTYPTWSVIVGVATIGYAALLLRLDMTLDELTHWAVAGIAAVAASFYVLVARRRAIAALVDAERNLENMAVSDNLTGVFNRSGLRMMGVELMAIAHRQKASVFAVFVDVDGLKAVNDSAGHDAGDAVLRSVAEQLDITFRKGDLVARWGGDEFVVLGIGIAPDALLVEQRLGASLATHPNRPREWEPSVSIGVAQIGSEDARFADVDEVIAQADGEMYRRRGERRR
ncbi:MAG: GGDEF domain-containing protein [Ilumatobacteraceae bacterium]|jgi:diguanylate cyclase